MPRQLIGHVGCLAVAFLQGGGEAVVVAGAQDQHVEPLSSRVTNAANRVAEQRKLQPLGPVLATEVDPQAALVHGV